MTNSLLFDLIVVGVFCVAVLPVVAYLVMKLGTYGFCRGMYLFYKDIEDQDGNQQIEESEEGTPRRGRGQDGSGTRFRNQPDQSERP